MNKAKVTDLHQRLLANLQANTTDTCSSDMHIPAAVFSEPDLYHRERQALFLNTPQPVAFSGEIPQAGSYLALQVLDIPILLSRDDSGQLHAFINACAHRGARVAGGSGESRRFVCPFHGWSYCQDGSLKGRPGEEHFSAAPNDGSLTSLSVSERYGIVVVGLSRHVPQQLVDSALEPLGEELASCNFADYRCLERRQLSVQANWKLVNDLSLESYHFQSLHRDSVAQMLAPNAVVDNWERHSRWAFPLKSIGGLADIAEKDWPDTLQGSVTYTLYPGVMFLVNALGAQMIRAEPGDSPEQAIVAYVGMYAPDSERDAAYQAYQFGGDVFANEDLPAAQECQRGMAARGGDFPIGRNEPLLQFWHRLWDAATRPAPGE